MWVNICQSHGSYGLDLDQSHDSRQLLFVIPNWHGRFSTVNCTPGAWIRFPKGLVYFPTFTTKIIHWIRWDSL